MAKVLLILAGPLIKKILIQPKNVAGQGDQQDGNLASPSINLVGFLAPLDLSVSGAEGVGGLSRPRRTMIFLAGLASYC